MLDLSSSNWNSHASGRSSAMSTNSKDMIFLRRVSGRGHRELAVLAAAGATIVEGRGDVAGKVGIAAMGAVRGGGILGIRGTPLRAVAVGVTPINAIVAAVVAGVVAA